MEQIQPIYGWKPDTFDGRDKMLKFGSSPISLESLPKKVDLREHCSTVENQFSLGSCTANAAVGALEYLEIKNGKVGPEFENFSRLFVYYHTRELQGTINDDTGGTLRDSIKALAKYGTCDENLWPYDITRFTIKPNEDHYKDAELHKITEYRRIESFPDMLVNLADGFPFVFGFSVYTEFEGAEVAKTGVLNFPRPDEAFMGGHAVCAVGYDMETKTVLVRNSWGEKWGQDGYFTMPFSYISNPSLAQDFWTIRR